MTTRRMSDATSDPGFFPTFILDCYVMIHLLASRGPPQRTRWALVMRLPAVAGRIIGVYERHLRRLHHAGITVTFLLVFEDR